MNREKPFTTDKIRQVGVENAQDLKMAVSVFPKKITYYELWGRYRKPSKGQPFRQEQGSGTCRPIVTSDAIRLAIAKGTHALGAKTFVQLCA